MLKRPKPSDDENEILRMQDEYLAEKSKNNAFEPAAKVVNLRTEEIPEPSVSGRKPSKYAKTKGLKSVTFDNVKSPLAVGNIVEKNVEEPAVSEENKFDDDKVHYPLVLPSILGEIVQKNTESFSEITCPAPPRGFPVATKFEGVVGSKGSVFSQHMSELRRSESQSMDVDAEVKDKTNKNIPEKSFIVTSNDAHSIHEQNMQMLGKMSEEEILEEQKKLLTTLDPGIIAFLKAKRANETHNKPQAMDISETADAKTSAEEVTDDSLWENDVLSHPNINKWLNFNLLEKDKLLWMTSVKERENKTNEPYEARFNFEGYLQPYTSDYNEETKTLFHHGEEPHRPGYSLTELFELTRSTVTQQRVVALNAIAGILEYYMMGTYRDIIEIPLSKVFFIIRYALDENKTIILEPALKAIRNLLYNKFDEASLDALMGFEEGTVQPCLENDKTEIVELESKESELKDFHLAEIDLIAAALRTDIIQRISYILDSMKPSFNSVQYCLQILIRISRDSVETARTLIETEHLMKTIVGYFVPRSSVNFTFDPSIVYKGKPILSALKLLRILSLQSKDICEILVNKYEILKPLSEYLSSTVDTLYGLRIQTESFAVISNVISAVDVDVSAIFPLIATSLYKHVRGTDIYSHSSMPSCTHASALLQLVNIILKNPNCKLKDQLYPLIRDGVEKWLVQLGDCDTYTCGHTRLVSSSIDCCITLVQQKPNIIANIGGIVKQFAHSKGYDVLVENLENSSNLLSGINLTNVDKNLVCIGSCALESTHKVLPILSITSSIPVLLSLLKLVDKLNVQSITKQFLVKLMPYLNAVKNKSPSLSSNWFTRMEIDLVCRIVKLSCNAVGLSETDKDIVYGGANKLCYLLHIDKRIELEFLFENIIFNKHWFTADRLLNVMSVVESDISTDDMNVEEIMRCYSRTVNLDYKDVGPNIVLRRWQEPILPRDWIYLPILKLYSESQDIKQSSEIDEAESSREKELVIRCSLHWIIFNELCFPDLLMDINITDRLCRIMCVFLCDNSLFLDDKVKPLLRRSIDILFKKDKVTAFNFNKTLTGLHNFQDFYTQFLEQFQSVSYGDYNFAACVLTPLAQRHDVKWRKLLWSEYAGCLRALHCPEESLCYDLECYLTPMETDVSLLNSYKAALSRNLLRPGTIAHRIAAHHVKYKNSSK